MTHEHWWLQPMGLGVLVLFLSLAGCSLMSQDDLSPEPVKATPVEKEVQPDGLGNVYNDPEGWFSLRYPEDWHVKSVGSETQFRADSDNTAGLAVSLWTKMLSPDMLLRGVAGVLEDKSAEYIILSEHMQTLDSYLAKSVEHTYTFGDFPQQGFMIGVVQHRVGYLFLAYAPPDRYGEFTPIFKAMVDSIHIYRYDALPPLTQWLTTSAANIRIHTPPSTYAADHREVIAADHMLAYGNITQKLGVDDTGLIDIYLYPSEQALYRVTARRYGFAINTSSEVHALWISETDRQSLGHEMTHVIAYRTLGEPAQALLGEGLAVCMDQATPSVHIRAATLLQKDHIIPLVDLYGDKWFSKDPAVTYPESGSLVCYLIEQYGVETVKLLYTRGDLQTALQEETGLSLETLESQWLAWLNTIPQ